MARRVLVSTSMTRSILALFLLLAACGDDTSALTGTTATGAGGSGAGGGGGAPSGELTLDSCETSFGGDVPAFYAAHFACMNASVNGGDVVLTSNGLPPHPSTYYDESHPNYVEFDNQGGTHFKNPNQIAEQSHSLTIPSNPVPKGITITEAMVDGQAGGMEEYHGMLVGLALDGVAFFHGVAAPGDNIEDEAFSFDPYEGHPQNTGVYHYHGVSPGPLEALAHNGVDGVELYAIMCDGTLVLGCTELDGSAPSGAVDAQNGHVHDLVGKDGTTHFSERYHTHVCPELFPGHAFSPEIQYYDSCGG